MPRRLRSFFTSTMVLRIKMSMLPPSTATSSLVAFVWIKESNSDFTSALIWASLESSVRAVCNSRSNAVSGWLLEVFS